MALKTICSGVAAVGVAGTQATPRAPYTLELIAYGTSGSISGTVSVSNTTDKFLQTDTFTISPTDTAPALLAKNEPYAYVQISITSASGDAKLTSILSY